MISGLKSTGCSGILYINRRKTKQKRGPAKHADPRMVPTSYQVTLEPFLEPLADFVPRLGRESGRLNLDAAGCVHGDADAGDEAVGEDFQRLALLFTDGDLGIDRLYGGDDFIHLLLRHETGGENEFLRVSGINLSGGETFERGVRRMGNQFPILVRELQKNSENGHNQRHERGDDLKNLVCIEMH